MIKDAYKDQVDKPEMENGEPSHLTTEEDETVQVSGVEVSDEMFSADNAGDTQDAEKERVSILYLLTLVPIVSGILKLLLFLNCIIKGVYKDEEDEREMVEEESIHRTTEANGKIDVSGIPNLKAVPLREEVSDQMSSVNEAVDMKQAENKASKKASCL